MGKIHTVTGLAVIKEHTYVKVLRFVIGYKRIKVNSGKINASVLPEYLCSIL